MDSFFIGYLNITDMPENSQAIRDFDPDGVGEKGKLFGLPFDATNAELIIIPVPWEVTVSYSSGTAMGPEAILNASSQIDLYQDDILYAWKMGMSMLPIPKDLHSNSDKFRMLASNYIQWLELGSSSQELERFGAVPKLVDEVCDSMNSWVYGQAKHWLENNKMVALLGGDHSTPFGLIRALTERHRDFGILQIDAHADLRVAYEDFTFSHASIAYNFIKFSQISKLVQVGIRDFSESEKKLIQSNDRIRMFTDDDLKETLYSGTTWKEICDKIIKELPEKVYITIDIDGLDPKLCPNTGTPVPGGMEYSQLMFLMKTLVLSGRQIIGFDLVEVAPDPAGGEWDANVGARVLYRMANLFGISQGKLSFS